MSAHSTHPLLEDSVHADCSDLSVQEVLGDLSSLAFATASLPERSIRLYTALRKLIGQPQLEGYLRGIQLLAQRNSPAGARLLAALLDANTPGEWLIPRIHAFASSRRLKFQLAKQSAADPNLRQWKQQFSSMWVACQPEVTLLSDHGGGDGDRLGREAPISDFRSCLRRLISACYLRQKLTPEQRQLLVDLARLEIDAYAVRVSRLAGLVNPYRVATVSRLLPRLSRADTEIRDFRQFVGWIEAGQLEKAFHERHPRLQDAMEPEERDMFLSQLARMPTLSPLAGLLQRLSCNPQPVPQLAARVSRIMALAHHLLRRRLRRSEMDLLTAVRIVQDYGIGDEVQLPLNAKLERQIERILTRPQSGPGMMGWPLDGYELGDGLLRLSPAGDGQHDDTWPNDLPSQPRFETWLADRITDELSTAEIQRYVLRHLDNVSVMKGFLRNPRITAIPGLVADIAVRCRSLVILSDIANNRVLYTGYANKGVPRALLCSPCNIPVGSLRKFIHVKYISKLELTRMARDKVGLRDEVVREIERYLGMLVT